MEIVPVGDLVMRHAPHETRRKKSAPFSRENKDRIDYDLRILDAFTKVYCRKTHHVAKGTLCPDCDEFLTYAQKRRAACPLDPKPKCKDCPVHCYKPEMRAAAVRIMRVGGRHYLLRGRLDWLLYFLLAEKGRGA